jgi:hypothetical protein
MRSTLALRPLALGAIFLLAALIPAGEIGPYDNIGKIVTFQKPEDAVAAPSTPPPRGAVVLFDGKHVEGWHKSDGKTPAGWKLLPGGIMQAQGGDIISRQQLFGSFRLHVEFRVPYTPKTPAQNRGKSGIFLLGRHEIHILDSYGHKSGNQDCGAISTLAAPRTNECKPATIWQTFDIDFAAPQCKDGKQTAPAVVTVYHNGVKIHDRVKLTKDHTPAGKEDDPCTPGPILLKDYGSPVQFRNIWFLPGEAAEHVAPQQLPADVDLTGTWKCNDGGTYYIRQTGNVVWWNGVSKDNGKTFTNVFRGVLQVNPKAKPGAADQLIVAGNWVDVKGGKGGGALTLDVVVAAGIRSANELRKQTGAGFGGQTWERDHSQPPARWSLPVKLHAQETNNWCWAASGEMVMAYFGRDVSQAAQANHALKRSDCGMQPVPAPCDKGGSPDFAAFGFTCQSSNKPLSRVEIVHQIYTLKKPIPYSWGWKGGGGHVMVVIGYVKQTNGTFMLQSLNPWPPLHKDKTGTTGGNHEFITYERWVEGPDHKLTWNGFNVTRKK